LGLKLTRIILSYFLLFVFAATAQNGPETAIRGDKRFRKTTVTTGLAGPWEITWGPDNHIWATERTGKRVTRVNPTTGERKVAVTIDDVSAPGGQDGLLGMALHPGLLQGTGNDFVYVVYTYVDRDRGPDPSIKDLQSPYRFLYAKIVRYTYNAATQTLASPLTVIAGLPAGNDHNAGRLKFGPDQKLYLTLGDQGNNQLGNVCLAVESQRLPTAQELQAKDFVSYVGKSLRLNLDGSIPKDNPSLNGVVSHVFTYGHRNPQGLDFGPDGTLYSSEQGPKTDDEVNILKPGGNYGWPHVVGFKDNKAYEFARWAEATTPCAQLRFSDLAIHPSVPRQPESAFTRAMVDPLATLFTVPSSHNFADPICKGIDYICWPTVAVSSIEHYQSKGTGVTGWDRVLLVTTLKRGSLYVVPLKPDGKAAAGYISRFFQSENRFRDTAISPDGKTIYIATDASGVAEALAGGIARRMQDRGSILAFTYLGEGKGGVIEDAPAVTEAKPAADTKAPEVIVGAVPPQFTAAQSAAGKLAYNSNCAVCHGSTMTNGTFGTPLAGQYFKTNWYNRSVGSLVDRARKTMPPSEPDSIPADDYLNIITYILDLNGFKPGDTPLPATPEGRAKMVIK
jgi:PQQ-dependent dehydrogenase (s-GDH family)